MYSSIQDPEVVLVFERNNAGLKKLSQVLSEQTYDSSAFLNAMCLLKCVLNCEQHLSCFIFRSGLARVAREVLGLNLSLDTSYPEIFSCFSSFDTCQDCTSSPFSQSLCRASIVRPFDVTIG
jgi:hypothetical protein